MMDYNYRKYYFVHFKLKNKNHSINSKIRSQKSTFEFKKKATSLSILCKTQRSPPQVDLMAGQSQSCNHTGCL
jgi:hypothetical protein